MSGETINKEPAYCFSFFVSRKEKMKYPKISQASKLVFRVKTKDPILNICSIFILKKTRQLTKHSDFVKGLTISMTLNIGGISF